jgi:hypothetical protein
MRRKKRREANMKKYLVGVLSLFVVLAVMVLVTRSSKAADSGHRTCRCR